MKKLMIAAAVALAGIAVNAATYNWQWGTTPDAATKAFDASADKSAGTIYLVWGFTSSSNANDSRNALLQSLMAVTDGDYASVITGNANFKDSQSLTDGTLGLTAFTETTSGGAKTYAYSIILDKDAAGNTWAYFGANKNAKGVEAGSGTGAGTLSFTVDGTDTFKAGDFSGYESAGWYQVQAGTVPEPTSGLLLLLGVAGLALRRRRA